jgi:hypothetical protein
MLLLAVWRIRCIGLGPDPDTDAYGHYVIARQFLETPFDLHIHWVWLPLYHLLLAAGVAAGATLDHVRYANALLSAGTPLLLWWGLRLLAGGRLAAQPQPLVPRWLPALAALFAAAAPIAIVMGTTAQPESCFALVLLAAAVLLALGRWGGAAFVLGALVLLRYEAWAAAASVAALLSWRRWRGQRLSRGALGCLLVPPLSIAAWAVLRRLDGGQWFDFLRQNQSFAEAARASSAPLVNWPELVRVLAAAPLGAWLLAFGCLLCGLGRTWRLSGGWFVVLPLSIAGFLVLGWATRSHLGLTRHWVCLVPFAATAVAQGIAQLAEWIGRLESARRGAHVCAARALALGLELRSLELPLQRWREHTAAALPDRRAAGRFLRSLPPSSLILCDDAAAEVLSQLPSSRFARDYLGADARRRCASGRARRTCVVLSSAERLSKALPLGEVVYGDPAGTGLIGLHVARGS